MSLTLRIAIWSMLVPIATASVQIVPPCPGGGVYPDFVFVPDGGSGTTMTLDLGLAQPGSWNAPAADGHPIYDASEWVVVYFFHDVTIPSGTTLKFKNRAGRPPVALLASGNLTVSGTIDVSGQDGGTSSDRPRFAEPGPGGFRGGRGVLVGGLDDASSGFGPGGALRPLAINSVSGGGGGYGEAGGTGSGSGVSGPGGHGYGTSDLSTLIGGSGGAGPRFLVADPLPGAGAGGGAILLACDHVLAVESSGAVVAKGGAAGDAGAYGHSGGGGSGGAIRLVADSVQLATPSAFGSGAFVNATGGCGCSSNSAGGGAGRIRIERNNAEEFVVLTFPSPSQQIGQVGAQPLLRRSTLPRVAVTRLWVAADPGHPYGVPGDPGAQFSGGVPDVVLSQAGTATIEIVGDSIPRAATVYVRIAGISGPGIESIVTAPADGDDTHWTRHVDVSLPEGVSAVQVRAVLP